MGFCQMKPHIENIGLGIGVMAIFGYVLLVLIPAEIFVPAWIKIRALSPAFFPRLVSILMIGLGAGIIVQSLLLIKAARSSGDAPRAQPETEEREDKSLDFSPSAKIIRIGAAVLLLFSYYRLIGTFGMPATSIVMMPLFSFLYGNRNWKLVLPLSVVMAVSLYYFFAKVAHISIPKGSLFG